ncbi:sensor domain-containing diguanylate cyclase [Ramlibacter pallidus]|uniref:Diguanylate cyclase n=1 Tax=Ramlibacter pallidus TaxID=2780087 RepID=A0ABR9S6Z4_9BURK|nr:7TM-DISM domain-containing protein [Ramlibacter pallidus]MBE7369293.1 diguanylate cyclase [Ramlibacter pallidus]
MGAGWLVLVLALCCAQARANHSLDVVRLDPARPELPMTEVVGWFGPQPRGGISTAAGGGLPFAHLPEQILPFREGRSLWLRLRVRPPAGTQDAWLLEVPVPVIDHVALYQQDASGRWFARSAGDLVPMRDWPQPGRYPFFQLQLRPGAPTELYLEVRHSTSIAVPVRVVTATTHHQRSQMEYLGLGLAIGALGLLALGALVRAVVQRDAAFGWYAAYGLVATLGLAGFTGVAGHLLWGDAGAWVDRAPGFLAILGASLVLVIVGRLSRVLARVRWLGRILQWLAALGPALALLYLLPDKRSGVMILAAYLIAVAIASLCAAAITLRRRDRVGVWMLLGALPLAICVVIALGRVTGWLQPSWLTEYVLALALTVDLPLLLGALNARSQERRSLELRRLAAEHQDALTGLMKREPFTAKLRQAIGRYTRRGEGAAVAIIELANHAWVQKTLGAERSEEALLRTVIKLRRLVRDIDTVGRLGENRFGLILEGAAMRKPMANFGARLVASGLMEEPGRPKDVPLHFHVAAVVLHERSGSADELMQALGDLLAEMGARTHKPVRFLDAGEPSTVSDGTSPAEGRSTALA